MSLLSNLDSLNLPTFRKTQILTAWCDPGIDGWDKVSTLPKSLREEFSSKFPWISTTLVSLQQSPTASKALLELQERQKEKSSPFKIETVLMINPKNEFTACISSQVGCAMACDFCATGTMGFFRDLSTDEIVDQVRFWKRYLRKHFPEKSLTNLVLMGMGEPLNNYENVKKALHFFTEHLQIGKTKITLSTVGVRQGMDKILTDPEWPDVRIAISLHYANQEKRKSHMPVAKQRTLEDLKKWCQNYLKKFGNRKHHLTFEYLMLEGKNDGPQDVRDLEQFLKGIDRYKINLIPWNEVPHLPYSRASREKTEAFQKELLKRGIFSTIRKSLGREIDAGCGQLVVLET